MDLFDLAILLLVLVLTGFAVYLDPLPYKIVFFILAAVVNSIGIQKRRK
jgi:hypothetical protein